MERSIKEQVGAATWESWPVGARMAIADAQATIAALQAQLKERTAERDTARRRVDELEAREVDVVLLRDDLEQRTAELERVSLLHSHNERRLEVVDKRYKELHGLILALPKVEGEIVAQAGYVKDRKKVYACFGSVADMTAYAAIVQHRQGMEG